MPVVLRRSAVRVLLIISGAATAWLFAALLASSAASAAPAATPPAAPVTRPALPEVPALPTLPTVPALPTPPSLPTLPTNLIGPLNGAIAPTLAAVTGPTGVPLPAQLPFPVPLPVGFPQLPPLPIKLPLPIGLPVLGPTGLGPTPDPRLPGDDPSLVSVAGTGVVAPQARPAPGSKITALAPLVTPHPIVPGPTPASSTGSGPNAPLRDTDVSSDSHPGALTSIRAPPPDVRIPTAGLPDDPSFAPD